MNTKRTHLGICCAALATVLAAPSYGASIMYLASEPSVVNAHDADPGNVPVSGSAIFTPGTNQLTITLTNTTPLTRDAGELLTALDFTVDNLLASTPTMTSGMSTGRTVDASGHVTDMGPVDLKALNTWSAGAVGALDGLNYTLDSKYGIIGAAESGGGTIYAQANSSIAGNLTYQPYANQTATFVLNIPGLTVNSTIDSVMFRFGTEFETCPAGVPNAVGQPPELVPLPASFWSGGVLLAVTGAMNVLRRRRTGLPSNG